MIRAGGLIHVAASLALPFTLAGVLFALLAALQALAVGAERRARILVATAGVAIFVYGAVLIGASLASADVVLLPGQEKMFCGLDCDLAFSVPRVLPAKPSAASMRAFYAILRARSDARGALITPSSVRAWLVSAGGRRFDPASGRAVRYRAPIPPGARVDVSLRFDVPAAARDLRLVVTEGGAMTRLVIGDENSFFHRKTVFRLPD